MTALKSHAQWLLLILITLYYILLYHHIVHTRIDGDVMNILVNKYHVVLFDDPFGINAIKNDLHYPNINRFFSSYGELIFFKSYRLISNVLTCDKIDLLYGYIAIFKLSLQASICLLMCFILRTIRAGSFSINFIIFTSFFQYGSLYSQIGIIDTSINYCFFYALSLIPLLLFYLLLLNYYGSENPSVFYFIILIFVGFFSVFWGSINILTHLLILPFLLYFNYKEKLKNWRLYIILSINFLFVLYSAFLGTYNSENGINPHPILERYFILFKGLFHILFDKFGVAIVLLLLVYYNKLIYHGKVWHRTKTFWLYRFQIYFIALYLFLIPLGGHRPYRPYYIRYDIIIPITICIAFYIAFAYSHLYKFGEKKVQYSSVFLLVILFSSNIFSPIQINNSNEKKILKELSTSKSTLIYLPENSELFSWNGLEKSKEVDLNNTLKLLGIITMNQKVVIQ